MGVAARRKFLEFDHVRPLARGGETSVDNLRLRCRAHNQLEAERTFGAGFTEAKRARPNDARVPSRVGVLTAPEIS